MALQHIPPWPDSGLGREITTPGDITFENRSFMRWESPILGVNFQGKVSPLMPGCQVVWTFTDEQGKTRQLNAINRTSDGFPAPTLAPLQPHANTLVACHQYYGTPEWDQVRARLSAVLGGDGRALTPDQHTEALGLAFKALLRIGDSRGLSRTRR